MKNVRRTAYGWQLYTRIRGAFVSAHTTEAPSPQAVRDWILKQRALTLGLTDPQAADGATFAADVRTYLGQVQTMPTYRERVYHLSLWTTVFGQMRVRSTITSGEIRRQLETWRAEGFAASTVNHLRTALMHLWSVLDGKSAPNPARDVPRYADEPRPPAALSPQTVRAVLAAMPPSQTKARLELMAWTGWPQKQIARLQPKDIAWNKAVFLRGRRKGKGVGGTWLPLLPQGWAALRQFKRLGCWGPFSASSMRQCFRRAAQHVADNPRLPKAVRQDAQDITPYQLRHSFGTLIAGMTGDDRAVQTLMLHADIRQTHRYTSATVDPRTAGAIAHVRRRLATLATFGGVSRGSAGSRRRRRSASS